MVKKPARVGSRSISRSTPLVYLLEPVPTVVRPSTSFNCVQLEFVCGEFGVCKDAW